MNGRMSDGGNWSRNKFRSLLEDPPNPLDIPEPYLAEPYQFLLLPSVTMPLHFLPTSIKPYPESSLTTEKRIFNYRLSRTRRISENVRIMAQKWQVLRSVSRLEREKATTVVLAIVALHHFLRSERCYVTVSDEELGSLGPATSWLDLPLLAKGQIYSSKAKAMRDEFCEYFNF